jgi:hypothetical protein
VVVDELAVAAGEERRAVGETCVLLLPAAGGRAFYPARVRGNPAAHRELADTRGIAGAVTAEKAIHKRQLKEEVVSEKSLGTEAVSGVAFWGEGQSDPFGDHRGRA